MPTVTKKNGRITKLVPFAPRKDPGVYRVDVEEDLIMGAVRMSEVVVRLLSAEPVTSIAAEYGICPSRLGKAFRSKTGRSVVQYKSLAKWFRDCSRSNECRDKVVEMVLRGVCPVEIVKTVRIII